MLKDDEEAGEEHERISTHCREECETHFGTELFGQLRWGGSRWGAGLAASRFSWPELLRSEYQLVSPELIVDGAVDRVAIDGWWRVGDALSLRMRADRFEDRERDGTSLRGTATFRDVLGEGPEFLGIMGGVQATGSIVGFALAGTLKIPANLRPLLVLPALVVCGLVAIMLGIVEQPLWTLPLLALFGVFIGISQPEVPLPVMAMMLLLATNFFSVLTPQASSCNVIFVGSGYLTGTEVYRYGGLTTLLCLAIYLVLGTPWLLWVFSGG